MISQFQSSGLNQVQFCKEHDLKIQTFKYWLYKLRPKSAPKSFIPIETSSFTQQEIVIEYPNGVKIYPSKPPTLAELRTLITLV